MTTRSMLFILRRLGFDAKVPGSSIVQLTGKCSTNAFTVQVDFGQFDFSDYATNQEIPSVGGAIAAWPPDCAAIYI
jgi:hypothetical protein